MTERVLEFDRLSKRYDEVVALRDVSFRVQAGELFGFVRSHHSCRHPTVPELCER